MQTSHNPLNLPYMPFLNLTHSHNLLLYIYISFKSGNLPDSMTYALTVILHKADKDRLLCESYRPISLLNRDVEILAKVLISHLNKVILYLNIPEQSGFMLSKFTCDNIRRLYLHIHSAAISQNSGLVVSLDVQKGLDTVRCPLADQRVIFMS